MPKLLLLADLPGAGRFNIDCMSQQMAMETLCADVENIHKVQDANGDFMPIESWSGLKFDSDGNISEIDFDSNYGANLFRDEDEPEVDENPPIGPGGSMELQWIPQSVRKFFMQEVRISGTVDTHKLPRRLEEFDISKNKFTGEFRTEGLPDTLRVLNIQMNNLSGSLSIAAIPRCMHRFYASYNNFSGEVNLNDLPPEIAVFHVQHNALCGSISMQRIPVSIKHMDIRHNNFEQDVLVVRATAETDYPFGIDRDKFAKIVDDEGHDVKDKFRA